MRKIVLVGALLLTVHLFANDSFQEKIYTQGDHQQSSEKFYEIKTKMLERQNQHLRMIQANMDCVKRADSMEDLKMCRKQAKEGMEKFKEQYSQEKEFNERNDGSNKMDRH